jgi:hypothetical protein
VPSEDVTRRIVSQERASSEGDGCTQNGDDEKTPASLEGQQRRLMGQRHFSLTEMHLLSETYLRPTWVGQPTDPTNDTMCLPWTPRG